MDELDDYIMHKPVHVVPSSFQLDPEIDLTLLSLGTKFIPTSRPSDGRDVDVDAVHTFSEHPRLMNEFQRQASEAERQEVATTLLRALERDTACLPNLTATQRCTLRRLSRDTSLVILNADKNLGLTVMTRQWYEEQIFKHLHDVTTYRPINDWNIQLKRINALLIRIGRQPWPPRPPIRTRNPKTRTNAATIASSSAPCRFYIIPKVHKTPPSSRPIAAACNYVTTPLSRRVTPYLQTMVNRLPEVVKNSTVFLRMLSKIPQPLPANALLFAADVESLYPNIETQWAMQLLTPPIHATFGDRNGSTLCYALHVVLTNLFVRYREHTFHQTSGCAMGTPLAPPYANLTMHYADLHVREEFAACLALLARYIDDYVGIWTGTEAEFKSFTTKMNALHPRIKIVFSTLSRSISFLDILISIEDGRITTKLFRKALNRYLYIPPTSQHHNATLRGWIRGEGIRIARTCSTKAAFQAELVFFRSLLRERGYKAKMIAHALSQVNYERVRGTLLAASQVSTRQDDGNSAIYLIPRYHPGTHASIRRALTSTRTPNARLAWKVAPSIGAILGKHR